MSSVNVVFLSWFMAEMHANYICVRTKKRTRSRKKDYATVYGED